MIVLLMVLNWHDFICLSDMRRKVTYYVASSLDGYIARDDGSVDWLPECMPSGYDMFYSSVDTVIMGKRTYDQILSFGCRYPYRDKKTYVFSRDAACLQKDSDVEFAADLEKFIPKVLSAKGNGIWLVGGATMASSFLDMGFLDEIILNVIPVVLGRGIPLFVDLKREVKMEPIKSTKYGKITELHYRVLG